LEPLESFPDNGICSSKPRRVCNPHLEANKSACRRSGLPCRALASCRATNGSDNGRASALSTGCCRCESSDSCERGASPCLFGPPRTAAVSWVRHRSATSRLYPALPRGEAPVPLGEPAPGMPEGHWHRISTLTRWQAEALGPGISPLAIILAAWLAAPPANLGSGCGEREEGVERTINKMEGSSWRLQDCPFGKSFALIVGWGWPARSA